MEGLWQAIGVLFGFISNAVITLAEAVGAALAAVWAVLSPVLIPIWHVLKQIWSNVLSPFWDDLKSFYDKVKTWWDDWSGPVKTWLGKIQCALQDVYDSFYKPFLDAISRLRQFLEFSGLADTAFGRALDRILGNIQADLRNLYESVAQPINETIDKVENYILDVNQLLNAPLLLQSLIANIGSIWNTLWGALEHPITAIEKDELKRVNKRVTIKDISSSFDLFLESHTGPLVPAVVAGQDAFDAVSGGGEPKDLPPADPEV